VLGTQQRASQEKEETSLVKIPQWFLILVVEAFIMHFFGNFMCYLPGYWEQLVKQTIICHAVYIQLPKGYDKD
jgi:hypothetical protein